MVIVERLQGSFVIPNHAEKSRPESLKVLWQENVYSVLCQDELYLDLEKWHCDLAIFHADPKVPIILQWRYEKVKLTEGQITLVRYSSTAALPSFHIFISSGLPSRALPFTRYS